MNLLQRSNDHQWYKFRIYQALGPGEHLVDVVSPGPPVLVAVNGPDYDEQDRPSADIQAYHPDIDGISWANIWHAVGSMIPEKSSEEEYQGIKQSIANFGLLQRVIVDETGNILAGRLRRKACDELGVHCPSEVISGLTEEQKEDLSFQLDYCRKHLSLADKRHAADFLLRSNPRDTDRAIARICGLDHKTVGSIREILEEGGEIPQVERRLGSDGKTYKFPKVIANTKWEEQRAQTGLQELGGDAPSKPLNLKQTEKLVRKKRFAERRAAAVPVPLPDDSVQIIHNDFRDLLISDESIRLIMTDPPYDQESLPLWDGLAAFAKRVLQPDGFLVTYAGTMFLPQIMEALCRDLTFVWQFAVIHEGGQDIVWSRNIVNKYKPVLVFSKSGQPRSPIQINDVLHGGGKEKEFHEWQQNLDECMHFVESFSNPGDLVVDPFGGGFTTAAACYRLGRKCLSCDVDAMAVRVGLQRLADERERRERNK